MWRSRACFRRTSGPIVATDDSHAPLVICAKSEWDPPVRREHAWAMLAASSGHRVTFVERPADVRLDSVEGMRAAYIRWIVQGPGPYTVTIRSVKGGVATMQVP